MSEMKEAGGLIDEGEAERNKGVDASGNDAVEKELFNHHFTGLGFVLPIRGSVPASSTFLSRPPANIIRPGTKLLSSPRQDVSTGRWLLIFPHRRRRHSPEAKQSPRDSHQRFSVPTV